MKKLDISVHGTISPADKKMIKVIDYLVNVGTIKYRQEFLDVIGMKKQNYRQIEIGTGHFRVEHITRACKEYNVNANWILGIEKNMIRE